MTTLLDASAPRAAPGTYPIPDGRGRWRLTLHNRQFQNQSWSSTMLSDLPLARNKKLVQAWDTPAVLTFDYDGRAMQALYIQELATDVVAWRWDDTANRDVAMFRGVIAQSQDAIDEQSHVVSVTAHDYLAVLERRITTPAMQYSWTADQDVVVDYLRGLAAENAQTAAGQSFGAASYLPLTTTAVKPDGSARTLGSTVSRTVTVQGGTTILSMIDTLAKLNGGFDYDVQALPNYAQRDALRIFYPQQGVTRTSPTLFYPGNVIAITRQVTSADYSNYWRTVGNNQQAAQNAAQQYGEATVPDAFQLFAGTWMTADQTSDQTDQNMLGAVAAGQLNIYGLLLPTYTLTLSPTFWWQNCINMGDTVPLVVQSGRLKVTTTIRVMGIEYDDSEEGVETVVLTCGRPKTSLMDMFNQQQRDIRELARR